ncbi:hypothetical protein BJX65DRAFT_301448 [Aspergillus insuetus]
MNPQDDYDPAEWEPVHVTLTHSLLAYITHTHAVGTDLQPTETTVKPRPNPHHSALVEYTSDEDDGDVTGFVDSKNDTNDDTGHHGKREDEEQSVFQTEKETGLSGPVSGDVVMSESLPRQAAGPFLSGDDDLDTIEAAERLLALSETNLTSVVGTLFTGSLQAQHQPERTAPTEINSDLDTNFEGGPVIGQTTTEGEGATKGDSADAALEAALTPNIVTGAETNVAQLLYDEIATLQVALGNAEETISVLRDDLDHRNLAISQPDPAAESAGAINAGLDTEITTLKEKLAGRIFLSAIRKKQLRSAQLTIERLYGDLGEQDVKLEEQEERIEKLEAEKSRGDVEFEGMDAEIEGLKEEVRELESSLDYAEGQVELLQNRLQQLEDLNSRRRR